MPHTLWQKIRKLKDKPNVLNAGGKSVPIVGTIELVVQIVTNTENINFLDAEKLATSVILVCGFCDIHVEATKPLLAIVEMDGGSTVPIVRQNSKSNTNVPIHEEQCFFSLKNCD